MYIETGVVLNSLDVLNLIGLAEARVEELKNLKSPLNPNSIPAWIADEQIENYELTLKKLKNAKRRISELKRNAEPTRAR